VPFGSVLQCDGAVEDWLNELMVHICNSLRDELGDSLQAYVEQPRERFLAERSAQHAITTSQVWWTTEVNAAFERLEQGNETAVKEYVQVVVGGLEGLSRMVLGELTNQMRTKIKTIITIEVHSLPYHPVLHPPPHRPVLRARRCMREMSCRSSLT
jgi:dynein heavy chain